MPGEALAASGKCVRAPSLFRAERNPVHDLQAFHPTPATATCILATPGMLFAQSAQLSGTGTVEYTLVHKFHKFVGVSKAMAVRGQCGCVGAQGHGARPGGTFDSDNSNRDSHMMETVEGEKYP